MITKEQRIDRLMLNEFRSDLEHVKPQSWCLEVGGLPRMSVSAAAAFGTLLQSFAYRLEKLNDVEAAILKLKEFGLRHPSSPPETWSS
jgi:hypothetical protein